jgi:hypothetical protein
MKSGLSPADSGPTAMIFPVRSKDSTSRLWIMPGALSVHAALA